MKPTAKILTVLTISLALTLPAQADWGHHHGHRHHHHHQPWRTAAAAVAIAGVVGATTYYSTPPVTVVQAPQAYYPQSPSPRIWYFCASAGQYYPYARYCPEGWQAVAPQPRW